jgi:hypothetical protein
MNIQDYPEELRRCNTIRLLLVGWLVGCIQGASNMRFDTTKGSARGGRGVSSSRSSDISDMNSGGDFCCVRQEHTKLARS